MHASVGVIALFELKRAPPGLRQRLCLVGTCWTVVLVLCGRSRPKEGTSQEVCMHTALQLVLPLDNLALQCGTGAYVPKSLQRGSSCGKSWRSRTALSVCCAESRGVSEKPSSYQLDLLWLRRSPSGQASGVLRMCTAPEAAREVGRGLVPKVIVASRERLLKVERSRIMSRTAARTKLRSCSVS